LIQCRSGKTSGGGFRRGFRFPDRTPITFKITADTTKMLKWFNLGRWMPLFAELCTPNEYILGKGALR
jgi:hypothetical protein